MKPRFDLSQEPLEGLTGQSILLNDALGAESGASEAVHKQGGVGIRLFTQSVIALHNHELLAQFTNTCHKQSHDTLSSQTPVIQSQSHEIIPNENPIIR